jgi:hypothetical protein
VRITGQLIDRDTGAHLWADRFDGSLEDVFDLQDQITTSVVTAIAPKITQAEIERTRRKPAENLDAYDLHLRALALSHQSTPESLAEACGVLRRAMEIDPPYTPAAALWLFCFGWAHSEARGERPETREAVTLARRIMSTATDDLDVLWVVGWILPYLTGEIAAGAALIERSVALNPNCAQAWLACGYVYCYVHRNEAAVEAWNVPHASARSIHWDICTSLRSLSRDCRQGTTRRRSIGPPAPSCRSQASLTPWSYEQQPLVTWADVRKDGSG